MKRSNAEIEVFRRGGVTLQKVSNKLDYLVIGSAGSSLWKYESEGIKLSEARKKFNLTGRPQIIEEELFQNCLETSPVIHQHNESKIVEISCRMLFFSKDIPLLGYAEKAILKLKNMNDFVIKDQVNLIRENTLFESYNKYYEMRFDIFKEVKASIKTPDIVCDVESSLRELDIHKEIKWSEMKEGSLEYFRMKSRLN